jgi:hypothetical protein
VKLTRSRGSANFDLQKLQELLEKHAIAARVGFAAKVIFSVREAD